MTSKLSYIQQNLKELVQTKTSELSAANISLEKDLRERILMEEKVALLHQNLMQASRRAGMADVATSVLHNIGNILNSVIISITLIQDGFKNPNLKNLENVISMIGDHLDNLSYYFLEDEKGKLIPAYLMALQKSLNDERMNLETEIKSLRVNVSHIENILVMQQSIGGKSVIAEEVYLPDIVEMALQICGFSTIENIKLEKKYAKSPTIVTDKSKLIQILVNLLLNARDALTIGNYEILNKTIAIEIDEVDEAVELVIRDNGSGVLAENLTKIFSFGFSTKKKGHGFGLQSSALSAKELGGSLRVVSEGLRQGTAFILTLPKAIDSNELKDENFKSTYQE